MGDRTVRALSKVSFVNDYVDQTKHIYDELTNVQRIFIFLFYITSISVITLGSIVVIGVLFIFSRQSHIFAVGGTKPFITSIILLLCSIVLGIISALITFSPKRTKDKIIITSFVGFTLSVTLLLSGLVVIDRYQGQLQWAGFNDNSTIIETWKHTIKEPANRCFWQKIHDEYKCCGIESFDVLFAQFNKDPTSSCEIIQNEMPNNNVRMLQIREYNPPYVTCKTASFDSSQLKKINKTLDEFAYILGINACFCRDIAESLSSGCGKFLLHNLETKSRIIKLYSNIMFPILSITGMLALAGYLFNGNESTRNQRIIGSVTLQQ